ncbi:MAG: PAS domain S-box protein [Smithellaceae bacterium]|nr:PAS domain S-box protein [Syntrophaceae bacterium]MDD4239877.1 PAS domain S-box protein [Smithellaceae bacterium]NLX52638.1 PAS domain S-box protein [Deltaproteobacteria bacterium]
MPGFKLEKIHDFFRGAFSSWEKRARREGRDVLKAVLEDAGNSVWEWNVQSNEAHFSRQWMSMLGYDAHDMGGDISFWERLVHPDDRDKTFAAFALLVRGEVKTVNCEYRILHRDGDYRWVLNMARVVARDGRPLRMIVVQTDVTRQKQNEEALRESEEKYRILFEESNDLIFIFNPDGTFRYANRAFAKAVGMDVSDIPGQLVWHMFPQEEANRLHAAVTEVFADGRHHVMEIWVPRPSEAHYYMTSIDPVKTREEGVGSVMCIAKDITERKKAEEELLKSRDLTAKVFGNFPMAVYMKDYKNDGRYVIGNKMWDDLRRNSPQLSRVLSEFEDAALSTGSAVTFEHTVPASDGRLSTLKSNLIPLYDERGRLEYLLGMSEDVSDLKQMEAELVAKDAALAQASTEKAIAALVAGLSHDINNALGGITGGQDLTRMYLSRMEKTLARIETARGELAQALPSAPTEDPSTRPETGGNGFFPPLQHFLTGQLPRQLLEFRKNLEAARKYLSYVDSGGLVIRDVTSGIRDYVKRDHSLGSFEMRPAIRGAVSLSKGQYKPMAQDQGKTVSVEICETSPPVTVFGNAGEFMGVVVNLINNAVAEFPRGGSNVISISWEKEENTQAEDVIRVCVANDGPPIPEHVLARLFAEKVRSTHGGSGIGLLAVKSTLDRFGARIRHTTDFIPPEKNGRPADEARRGKSWTTFEMDLLIADAREETRRIPEKPPVLRRLLVVDDEKYMLDIMEKYAENLGHSAVIFDNPKDALTWYREHSDDVDVVISDQCMPDMNGCEMISTMKSLEPEKTFMIMTGHGALTLSREDTKDVHLLVRKPFDQQELCCAIEDAIAASRRPPERAGNS